MKYLLVEDNHELANAICSRIKLDGHVIDHADRLEDAIAYSDTGEYDLILLDIMLPDGDGRSFLKHHRNRKKDTPVIVLTARSQVSDRINILDLGADDYVTKSGTTQPILKFGDVSFNPLAGQLTIKGKMINLRNRELRLFELLLNARGQIFSKQKLVDRLFAFDEDVSDNAIEVYVGRLRKHLENTSLKISTHRGLGYRLDDD